MNLAGKGISCPGNDIGTPKLVFGVRELPERKRCEDGKCTRVTGVRK